MAQLLSYVLVVAPFSLLVALSVVVGKWHLLPHHGYVGGLVIFRDPFISDAQRQLPESLLVFGLIITFYFPAQLQTIVTLSYLLGKACRGHGRLPSPPPVLAFIIIAHRVHSASPLFSDLLFVDFHRILLTHALALSPSHFF